ncbi:class I SAM-dependent methyltransferase [Pseudoxanthomonas wuyuanensis]
MTDLPFTLVQLITPNTREAALSRLAGIIGTDGAERLRTELKGSPYTPRHNGLSTSRCRAWLDAYLADHEFSPTSIRRVLDYYRRYGLLLPDGLSVATLQGRRVLDYGCGLSSPLNFGVLLYLNGADSVLGVDPGTFDKELSAASLKALSVEILSNPAKFDLAGVSVDMILARFGHLDWERLYALQPTPQVSAIRTDVQTVEGPFDLVFSTSVLEHVMEPRVQFARLHAITAPGALMVHRIDFTDHRHHMPNYHKFGFMLDGQYKGLNGLRYVDIRRLLVEAGFEVVREDTRRDKVPDDFMSRVVPPFERYTLADLTVGYAGVSLARRSVHL